MAVEALEHAYRFSRPATRCPFSYNTLHDMESTIWVGFTILLHVEHGDVDIRDDIVYKLFSGDDRAASRQVFLSWPHETHTYYAELLGKDGEKVINAMLSLNGQIFHYYTNFETTVVNGLLDCTKLHGIHLEFRKTLSECRQLLPEVDINIEWNARTFTKMGWWRGKRARKGRAGAFDMFR